MLKRIFLFAAIATLAVATFISCSKDIPDCPSQMCIIAGGWQLTTVYEDGQQKGRDVSQYKLTLSMPDPNATEGTFNRLGSQRQDDAGKWKIQNNDTELALMPETRPLETYIIESFTLRELILVINRESNKVGPKQIKYIFEPF